MSEAERLVSLFVYTRPGRRRVCTGVLLLERLHGQVMGGGRLPILATVCGAYELCARAVLLQPVRRPCTENAAAHARLALATNQTRLLVLFQVCRVCVRGPHTPRV